MAAAAAHPLAHPHIKVRSQNSFHLDVTREIASLEGHLFALPILFINLGGEMIYVIEHRLRAQKLDDRIDKVMQDVIGTIFRPRIVDELFKPQHLLSETSMRSLFQKLAHASVMSLSAESMEKLLDLMSSSTKYQIFACNYPSELIYCTFNHLDYMRDLVKNTDTISNSLRKVYNHIDRVSQLFFTEINQETLFKRLLAGLPDLSRVLSPEEFSTYCRMDIQNLVLLRNTILRFFQDRKTRLSVFLTNGVQRESDGCMKIARDSTVQHASHINPPGKIIFYKTVRGVLSSETTETSSQDFHPGAYVVLRTPLKQTTIFDIPSGNRGSALGTNVFTSYKGTYVTTPAPVVTNSQPEQPMTTVAPKVTVPTAATGAAEIDMLARILGGAALDEPSSATSTRIELDFLEDDDSVHTDTTKLLGTRQSNVKRVELVKGKVHELDLGLETLRDTSAPEEDDLLSLMDAAAQNK